MTIKTLSLLIIIFFIHLTSTSAQVYEIDDVAIKNFKGVFELKEFGYAACFRKDGKWLLEILDRSLVKKTTTVLDFKIKEETVISGFSNGKTFLLTFSNTEKKHHIIGFEYTGRIIKRIDIDEKLGEIIPAKNKGFYLPIHGKKKENGRLLFLSNHLDETWNLELPIRFPSYSLYTLGSSPEQSVIMNGFRSASEDAILWNFMQKKSNFSLSKRE
jgi:hypothetical protein